MTHKSDKNSIGRLLVIDTDIMLNLSQLALTFGLNFAGAEL